MAGPVAAMRRGCGTAAFFGGMPPENVKRSKGISVQRTACQKRSMAGRWTARFR